MEQETVFQDVEFLQRTLKEEAAHRIVETLWTIAEISSWFSACTDQIKDSAQKISVIQPNKSYIEINVLHKLCFSILGRNETNESHVNFTQPLPLLPGSVAPEEPHHVTLKDGNSSTLRLIVQVAPLAAKFSGQLAVRMESGK